MVVADSIRAAREYAGRRGIGDRAHRRRGRLKARPAASRALAHGSERAPSAARRGPNDPRASAGVTPVPAFAHRTDEHAVSRDVWMRTSCPTAAVGIRARRRSAGFRRRGRGVTSDCVIEAFASMSEACRRARGFHDQVNVRVHPVEREPASIRFRERTWRCGVGGSGSVKAAIEASSGARGPASHGCPACYPIREIREGKRKCRGSLPPRRTNRKCRFGS